MNLPFGRGAERRWGTSRHLADAGGDDPPSPGGSAATRALFTNARLALRSPPWHNYHYVHSRGEQESREGSRPFPSHYFKTLIPVPITAVKTKGHISGRTSVGDIPQNPRL